MLNMAQTLSALAHHGAEARGVPAEYGGVSTDSRSIRPNELFIALRGDTFDGHDYVRDVLAHGAALAMVDRRWLQRNDSSGLSLLVVDDTRRAFASLAGAWRATFSIPVIGVVGSNGKTTVKEMIASIFAAEYGPSAFLATRGNLNNDIGVPTMLLRLTEAHRAAVIEMGMNHPGETALLAAMTQADIAVINNAQREHQEFMRSVAAVAEEHAAVIMALPESGIAILNADDQHFADWSRTARSRRILSFGFNATADVRAEGDMRHPSLVTPQGHAPLLLAAIGVHNLRNALAAAAATLAAGCSLPGVLSGLAAFRPVKGRLQMQAGLAGSTLIDDTYNANPDSVRAAIDVLAALPGRRVLVLGDMGEVGDLGAQYHDEVGGYAKSQGVESLLTFGDMSIAAARNFGPGAEHFRTLDDLLLSLKSMLGANTTVLVKGSRFMRMERVLAAIAVADLKPVKSSEGNKNAA